VISSSVGCSAQAEKDREDDSTASALEGKRALNAEEADRLKRFWKKPVRMFYPDLHEHDQAKCKSYGRLDRKSFDRIMDGRIILED
jgi:hypothetical protein